MAHSIDDDKHPIKQAFKTRLEGNELLKAGDYRAALLKYHAVLVALRGVNWPMHGSAQETTSPTSSPEGSGGEDSEASEAGEDDAEVEVNGKGKAKAEHEHKKEPEKTRPDDENMAQQIQQALKNTYLNSAAIYVKQERWGRALESAKAAQKYEQDNLKAKFREGQALIGLGRILDGKRLLEELQMLNPDPAVKAALFKLDQDEARRESKQQADLRGMFSRDTPSSKKDKQADRAAASTSSPTASTSTFTPKKEADVKPAVKRETSSPEKVHSKPMAPASTSEGTSPTAQVAEDVKNVAIKEEEKPALKTEQA